MFVAEDFLGEHRTRIDRVEFQAGTNSVTRWNNHDGHEFVLILKGTVECEFAVGKNDARIQHTLSSGDAIAFPSGLYHRFWNASAEQEAMLVAAKPSNSRSAAFKKSV